jgi:hypothetical protein
MKANLKYDHIGSIKALHCIILEASLYKEEIIRCATLQEFLDHLKTCFLDIRQSVASNTVGPQIISACFLLAWTDFLMADFSSFNHHIEGVILLLRSYQQTLQGRPFPPVTSYVATASCSADACIGFYGDKQRFPAELIPRDRCWVETFAHRDEISCANVALGKSTWMRSIANFRRWASTQREAAGFEDPFIEEAIARQGDTITAEIVAWAEKNIPKYTEIPPTPLTSQFALLSPGTRNDYSCYFRGSTMASDLRQFLHFPKVQFQDRAHCEITLGYLGLLLLVSFSTYPKPGHLPFSRWELAIKFCQCFAAHDNPEEMDMITRLLHMFYARLTFDKSFPQGSVQLGFEN